MVATTHDPAAPYAGAKRLVGELGNAHLLTMRGDGHTAYGNGSPTCIDPAIEQYLITLALPAKGTTCVQDVPFSGTAARLRRRALYPSRGSGCMIEKCASNGSVSTARRPMPGTSNGSTGFPPPASFAAAAVASASSTTK